MIVIDRKAPWILELAWLVAFLAELGHERSPIIIARERLDSMVVVLDEEQEASMMVERQAGRAGEWASCPFADRELDSSIRRHLIQEKRLQPSTQENRHKRERERAREREEGIARGEVCVMRRVRGQQANERTNQPTNDRNIQQHDDASLCSCVCLSLSCISCISRIPSHSLQVHPQSQTLTLSQSEDQFTLMIDAQEISIKATRRSRTAARSESSTSRSTHRPPIESSSSSTLLASSMMVHIDDDLDAM